MKPQFSRALLLVALAHVTIELSNNYLPVLYPRLMPLMGLNYTQVGAIALVAATSMALAQPLFGFISDRWGSVPLATLSIAWIGTAMGFVGFAPNYSMLLVLIALGSFGSAAFHPPAAVIAASNSGSKRGSGMSIFSVGGNIGAALSPLWMALALSWFGLRGTITILPLGLAFAAIFYLTLRSRSVSAAHQEGLPTATAANSFLLGMVLIIVAMMFRSWFQVGLTTYLPIWVEAAGGTQAAGATMLAIFAFSVSAGSLTGGPAGDRFGYWHVLIVALAFLPLAFYSFLHSAGAVQIASLMLSGLAVGATFPNSIVLVLEAWPHQVGVASGLLMGLGWWPGGLGASFTGYIADRFSLDAALSTLVLVPILGLICLLAYGFFARARRLSAAMSLAEG